MNLEKKKAWVDALRSGEYKQEDRLIMMNDRVYSFKEIANWIEEKCKCRQSN